LVANQVYYIEFFIFVNVNKRGLGKRRGFLLCGRYGFEVSMKALFFEEGGGGICGDIKTRGEQRASRHFKIAQN
jgi:hypothetical protein